MTDPKYKPSSCLIKVKWFCKKLSVQQGMVGFESLDIREAGGKWRSGRKCLLSPCCDLAAQCVEEFHTKQDAPDWETPGLGNCLCLQLLVILQECLDPGEFEHSYISWHLWLASSVSSRSFLLRTQLGNAVVASFSSDLWCRYLPEGGQAWWALLGYCFHPMVWTLSGGKGNSLCVSSCPVLVQNFQW